MQQSFSFPEPATDLGSLTLDVSAEANDRYWRGAGIDHHAREQHLLFPPMGVNFTMLLIQQTVSRGVLHTWGRITSRGATVAPTSVTITGSAIHRWVRRGRDYFTVASEVHADDGAHLWSLECDFADSIARADGDDTPGPQRDLAIALEGDIESRALTLTADRLRTYSRSGNFHSDDESAKAMGLPGMVAMGMQTLGPAYGILLDRWGTDLVESGMIDCRFVGMVAEGETADARMVADSRSADAEIVNADLGRVTALARFTLPH